VTVQDDVVMRAIGITKSYGATRALKGVDFSIRQGTVTVLFGENGAGKSTLMKILSGVESPTSGTLELDGEPLQLRDTVDAASRGIAIIHQELSLAPNLNVRDNIYMGREQARGGSPHRLCHRERDDRSADGAAGGAAGSEDARR
jgi:erythritol transport system ATP-binding protein